MRATDHPDRDPQQGCGADVAVCAPPQSGFAPRSRSPSVWAAGLEARLLDSIQRLFGAADLPTQIPVFLDGEAVREHLNSSTPDVLLLRARADLLDTEVSCLREAAPSCAIILLADTNDELRTNMLLKVGAQDVVLVDRDLDDLPALVRHAVPRARAQSNLWESRERLRATFEAMSSGVLVTDPDGRVLDANAAALSFLHIADARSVVGHHLADVVPSAAPLVAHASHDRDSISIVGPTGPPRVIGFSSTETPSHRSRVTVFRDVTRLMMAEERRRRAEQLAQVGEIAARLGHEIKNPLTSVLVALQIVEGAPELPRPLRDIVQTALDELRTAARGINELLSTARTSALSAQLVAVLPLVYDAVEPYRGFASSRGVSLRIDERTDPEVWVVADPAWLHRAITNLLVNAVEACSHGGKVDVTVRVWDRSLVRGRFPGYRGDIVSVRFTDDGPGIPAQELEKIFRAFHTTKPGGTGLGLAVALDAVDAHGGRLEVESTPGDGAAFDILLPLVNPLTNDDGPEIARPCGQRPRGLAHGCWLAIGHVEYVRTGRWPAMCSGCSVFQHSNLRHFERTRPPGG